MEAQKFDKKEWEILKPGMYIKSGLDKKLYIREFKIRLMDDKLTLCGVIRDDYSYPMSGCYMNCQECEYAFMDLRSDDKLVGFPFVSEYFNTVNDAYNQVVLDLAYAKPIEFMDGPMPNDIYQEIISKLLDEMKVGTRITLFVYFERSLKRYGKKIYRALLYHFKRRRMEDKDCEKVKVYIHGKYCEV